MKSISYIIGSVVVMLVLGSAVKAHDLESLYRAAGLVDVASVDSTIQVELVNSDPRKNIFRQNFYHGLKKAYLQKPVAEKLSRAQHILRSKYPSYSLKVLDAARPRHVSRAMYDRMKGTIFEKYVANPAKGSMHNYGIAVDITIVDGEGRELDMGVTPFKKSTFEIYWKYAQQKLGKSLNTEQRKNRAFLSSVMQQAGFYPLSYEWWHFNGMEKEAARRRYEIIE